MSIFRSLDLERMLIYQKFCFMKIKLPFDVQDSEKILHVIYWISVNIEWKKI